MAADDAYDFVAFRDVPPNPEVSFDFDLGQGLGPLRAHRVDDSLGLVLVGNAAFPDSDAAWDLDATREALESAGFEIIAIQRWRAPVAARTVTGRGSGERSVRVYGLEVRPMRAEVARLRHQLVKLAARHEIHVGEMRAVAARSDGVVEELGRALARMRKHEGWLEAGRRDSMENRALRAEARLAQVEASWTWRIGSAVLWLPRRLSTLFGRR
jgi:hypothetical protein